MAAPGDGSVAPARRSVGKVCPFLADGRAEPERSRASEETSILCAPTDPVDGSAASIRRARRRGRTWPPFLVNRPRARASVWPASRRWARIPTHGMRPENPMSVLAEAIADRRGEIERFQAEIDHGPGGHAHAR